MSKANWKTVKEYEDITYKKADGVARIAFNRPNVRNAFRPKTVFELFDAFLDAREDTSIGVVLLSAEGPSTKDGVYSFCSGGDQNARLGPDLAAFDRLRRAESVGRPLGSDGFLDSIAHLTGQEVKARKRGRKAQAEKSALSP